MSRVGALWPLAGFGADAERVRRVAASAYP